MLQHPAINSLGSRPKRQPDQLLRKPQINSCINAQNSRNLIRYSGTSLAHHHVGIPQQDPLIPAN